VLISKLTGAESFKSKRLALIQFNLSIYTMAYHNKDTHDQ